MQDALRYTEGSQKGLNPRNCAFSIVALSYWNKMPTMICQVPSLLALKTESFQDGII